MSLHTAIAGKLRLLEGIASWQERAHPAKAARMAEYDSWPAAAPAPDVDVRSGTAPGPHGDVPVRIYAPLDRAGDARPGLVWMHGGGFVGGDLNMIEADGVARQICVRAGAVVVSVDYRLCTGGIAHPVPHDDVVAAVRWVRDSAAELLLDAERISVGGASAGANLAAGAALRLRDDDHWRPVTLVLAYPVAHAVIPPAAETLTTAMTDLPRLLRFLPEDVRSVPTAVAPLIKC